MFKQSILFYKISLSLIGLLHLTIFVRGQQSAPAAYSSTMPVNYIRTWDGLAPESTPNNLMTRALRDSKQTTLYIDGIGRGIQTVVKQGSYETGGTATDWVNAQVYDIYGRESSTYSPFMANNTGGNSSITNGLFKLNPFQEQVTFMSGEYGGQGESFFYSQTKFELSPLSRVDTTFPIGNNWVGSNRGSRIKYWTNTATDDVRMWSVSDNPGSFGSFTMIGSYAAGTLIKTVSENEANAQVIEFKDLQGSVILKKVQLNASVDAGSGSGYAGWLCTYYVYDDLHNLRCVVQPVGVEELLLNGWNMAGTGGEILNDLSFRYEYDSHNRMILKKVPGAGEVRMVYDKWDRLILTQDANLRTSNQWLFTKYDTLNRPVMTGLYTNSTYTTQPAMQGYVSSLSLGRYESYTPGLALPCYTLSQTFPSTSVYTEVRSINFYDDYQWTANVDVNLRTFDNSFNGSFYTPSSSYPYPQALSVTSSTFGLVTGTLTKTTDGSVSIITTSFYDERARDTSQNTE